MAIPVSVEVLYRVDVLKGAEVLPGPRNYACGETDSHRPDAIQNPIGVGFYFTDELRNSDRFHLHHTVIHIYTNGNLASDHGNI